MLPYVAITWHAGITAVEVKPFRWCPKMAEGWRALEWMAESRRAPGCPWGVGTAGARRDPASLSSPPFQVQWVQGHNPDLIVLDDNGHEKDLSCKNGRATLIGIECVMKLWLSYLSSIALSHLPVLNRDWGNCLSLPAIGCSLIPKGLVFQ